ncbi:hypothetical protein, partial [Actinobacillus pleuropneumoniae]|uniref:hypothetical protein n=1 Tax=Actinobacillus pleuropneumoniae TaxID=715 RepID=UPI00227AC8ED
IEKIISLRSDLYILKVSKDEGILSCLSKASQIKGQLQDLGEMVSDKEMISVVLNALTDEQGNLISNKEEEAKAIPLTNLWTLCKIEEKRLKGQYDEEPRKRSRSVTKGKRKFKKL